MVAGAVPAPIQIPGQLPCQTREPHGAKQRHSQSSALAMAASVVLVTLVVMEIWTPHDAGDDRDGGLWVTRLVFPSQHVTWAKLVGLALGFVLTTSYFLSSQAQLASAEKMMIHSATALVSPLRRSPPKAMANDPNAPTPTGKTAAAWLASRCHSFLDTDDCGGGQAQDQDEIPQLKIRDECKAQNYTTSVPLGEGPEFEAVNRAQPLAFESEYFRGHMLFMVKDSTTHNNGSGTWAHLFGTKKRMLWVQVQGRFKRPLPPRAVTYLATELPEPDGFQVAFLTRQLVSLLIALVKKFVPTAHISYGENAANEGDSELPHAAFPLYQTADEFVVTDADGENDKTPLFGQEVFGESAESKKARAVTPVGMEPAIRMDAVYSFQFHTMYSDLAQWQIVNVPGMPDMDLKRFCGRQPIRLAIYTMATPGLHPGVLCDLPHKAKDKGYIFCFSMHHNPLRADGDADESLQSPLLLSPTASNPRSPPPPPLSSSPLRWRSVSCDQPDAIARQQRREAETIQEYVERRPQPRIRAPSSVRSMTPLERAADLSNWTFSLPVWVERVDPAAGSRKVVYVFVVEHKTKQRPRRCVVRSALTVKNALLLLDAKDPDTGGEHARAFKKLIVESREFQYESISKETDHVAQALQRIAATPSDQATQLDTDKQAMLFNCLMSESQLPCIRSFQDIGVQLPKTKRDRLDIIFETGVYRMPDPRFLRQEWFILTTTELQFFRSFTLKPGKAVPLSHVLGIRSVDNVPFFEPIDPKEDAVKTGSPRQRDATMRSTNRWYCVEIHLLSEIVTLFLDSASDRALCVASLTQLIKLKSGGSATTVLARLPPCRSLDAVTTPVCCNQRKKLPVGSSGAHTAELNPIVLAEDMAARGLRLFQRPRHEAIAADVVAFLDAVDRLCELDFTAPTTSSSSTETAAKDLKSPASCFSTNESRLAFALNLFHGLFVHAWLLFGDVRTHAQWKKRKSLVFYAIGNPRVPSSLFRVTLADIEHTLLQGRHAPGDEQPRSPANLPNCWLPLERDFRTSLALQTNSGPSALSTAAAAGTLRVYHTDTVSNELNETCALYLENELVVDDLHGVIQLPKICEWNLDDFLKGSTSIVQPVSRAFFCLQKLLPLMNEPQHDRLQHLLLGASKEYQIRFSARFWTQELRTVQTESTNGSSSEAAKSLQNAKDDLAIAPAGSSPAETTSDGIPRSKSALQFIQSLF